MNFLIWSLLQCREFFVAFFWTWGKITK